MSLRTSLVALLLTVSACAGNPDELAVGDNAAGITAVRVERSPGHTVVRGLDASGATIATASVLVGTVRYSLDEGLTYMQGHGREVSVQVANEPSIDHVSPGEPMLVLPIPARGNKTAAFLALPVFADVFPGVKFRAASAAGASGAESPYAGSTAGSAPTCDTPCNYARNASCGSTACAMAAPSGPNGAEEEFVCCGTSHQAVDRYCTGNPGGTNDCGAVGPSGCAVCWGSSYSSSCTLQTYTEYLEYSMTFTLCEMSWE